MIVFHGKVFEGGLSGNAKSAFSLPDLDSVLAQACRWYVTARCTNVSGTAPVQISVVLQQSASGSPSEFKGITASGKVPLDAVTISANAINIIEGSVRQSDANIKVPAAHARFEIYLGGADHNAYVELWVTARNDP